MSDHNFVLSDQDGVLVGHMSFQVKKLFAALQCVQTTFNDGLLFCFIKVNISVKALMVQVWSLQSFVLN